jgi:hypothetical protein
MTLTHVGAVRHHIFAGHVESDDQTTVVYQAVKQFINNFPSPPPPRHVRVGGNQGCGSGLDPDSIVSVDPD